MDITSKRSTRVLALACLLGAGGSAHAVGTADDTQHNVYVSAFKNLDRNGDGQLSKAEASKEDLFFENFDAADMDQDGRLDQAEYTQYRSGVEKKHLKRVLGDTEITARIKAELLKDAGIKSLKVDVETYKGVVLLSGFVDNQQQIEQAEKIARSVPGVDSVKNSLILKKQ